MLYNLEKNYTFSSLRFSNPLAINLRTRPTERRTILALLNSIMKLLMPSGTAKISYRNILINMKAIVNRNKPTNLKGRTNLKEFMFSLILYMF